jgi:hypothetical protein
MPEINDRRFLRAQAPQLVAMLVKERDSYRAEVQRLHEETHPGVRGFERVASDRSGPSRRKITRWRKFRVSLFSTESQAMDRHQRPARDVLAPRSIAVRQILKTYNRFS